MGDPVFVKPTFWDVLLGRGREGDTTDWLEVFKHEYGKVSDELYGDSVFTIYRNWYGNLSSLLKWVVIGVLAVLGIMALGSVFPAVRGASKAIGEAFT